ncbi:unnamed protein product [Clavelina lepadiformis]|uniref:Uncharacterized protein n=1 Tax=Clavelina lepadiformis TaxID=159417 RepID=A0ABP0FP76_CLALP
MSADVRTQFAKPVKQTYVTGGSMYRRNFFGSSRKETNPEMEAVGVNRINSALLSENDVSNYVRGNKDIRLGRSQVSFTKFRPVTSHPTTSLLASLYKQHTFAESRNSQTAGKLPNLIPRPLSQNAANQRKRELRSFTNPTYSTAPPNEAKNGNKSYASLPQSSMMSRSPYSRLGSGTTSVSASATWNAVHNSISASGHGLLPESQSTTSYPHQAEKIFSNRTSVNYVPFYEVRERGDGASVVDVPSIDVEGKKIEKLAADRDADAKGIENASKRHKENLKEEGKQESIDVLVSSVLQRSQHGQNSSSSPTKTEKKVRFSATVTTTPLTEQPSYSEVLIDSLQRSFKQKNYLNTAHGTVGSSYNSSADMSEFKSGAVTADSVEASSKGEEEQNNFATPVLKVVVTKRHAPAETDIVDESTVTNCDDTSHPGYLQHRVTNMASRIVNKYANTADKSISDVKPSTQADAIRRGTQATQRASTAGYSRTKEAMERVAKLVPKRQTVVMPNFPKQPAWACQNFPHHSRNPKLANIPQNSTNFSVSVQGNNFNRNRPTTNPRPPSNPENLRSRLTSASGGVYLTSSQTKKTEPIKAENPLPPQLPPTQQRLPPADNHQKTAATAPRNVPESTTTAYTDFQPISSMPDHINFCDPRKTELIIRWLDDVNKKRNIESRLRRITSSRTHT